MRADTTVELIAVGAAIMFRPVLEMSRRPGTFLHDDDPSMALWTPPQLVRIARQAVGYRNLAPIRFAVLKTSDFAFGIRGRARQVCTRNKHAPE